MLGSRCFEFAHFFTAPFPLNLHFLPSIILSYHVNPNCLLQFSSSVVGSRLARSPFVGICLENFLYIFRGHEPSTLNDIFLSLIFGNDLRAFKSCDDQLPCHYHLMCYAWPHLLVFQAENWNLCIGWAIQSVYLGASISNPFFDALKLADLGKTSIWL